MEISLESFALILKKKSMLKGKQLKLLVRLKWAFKKMDQVK